MPPILSSSKAVARFLSGKKRCLDLGVRSGLVGSHPEAGRRTERFAQTRCLASFAGCGSPCIGEAFRSGEVLAPSVGNSHRHDQRRWFLGCGDGEEGTILSKICVERRVIGYSPEQLFDVVAAVDMYEDFLPWCQRSRIIKRKSDESFDAELEIGFKLLVESYVSHVEMEKPKYIKVLNLLSFLT
ncbi:Polyketide cyclase / dehydrase and lipid transport [Musa troglodytarum]|uniref:Polyketide cyclase / dehydrase and lipid transport n=1 Tax=Musa troglodytarum TaxID=320322 RepID=A0A9E7GG64_9LILI|nr:Polyketide cyclase / dehydrase and lipid transport [Musa troglodytarum]